MICRGCNSTATDRVLDLGDQPAGDHFPLKTTPISPDETSHPLAMELCTECGLAQLAGDDTKTDEPRGVEPRALVDQSVEALEQVASAGWLRARESAHEFSSPHGGSWLPLLTDRGLDTTTARGSYEVVIDSFSMMHEPDQLAAVKQRAEITSARGLLLLQFHSLETIATLGQWNALRHGHFAYYSMTALQKLLAQVGMSIVDAWSFDLYGGTHLVAAVHGRAQPTARAVTEILDREREFGIVDTPVINKLQAAADDHVVRLRRWLITQRTSGKRVCAYGAASRAGAVFYRAGLDHELVDMIADASPAKHGRRMPGTDIPIVSPPEMIAMDPDHVLLMLPDLLEEVTSHYPQLAGKWVLDNPLGFV